MRLRRFQFARLLRVVAALMLVVFFAAETLCFFHCKFEAGNGARPTPACHVAAGESCHANGAASTAGEPAGAAPCPALKNMVAGSAPLSIGHPELAVLYVQAPFAPLVFSRSDMLMFRPAKPSDWVFTPEVYLGPAFRSLAPPSMA